MRGRESNLCPVKITPDRSSFDLLFVATVRVVLFREFERGILPIDILDCVLRAWHFSISCAIKYCGNHALRQFGKPFLIFFVAFAGSN